MTPTRGFPRPTGIVALVLGLCYAALALAQVFEPLTIVSGASRHGFEVEVARTDADRSQGLMFRRTLAPDRA